MDRLTLLDTGFEGYPADHVTHNVPLIVLSGLESQHGTDPDKVPERYRDGALRVKSDAPLVTGQPAEQLLQGFKRFERSDEHWNAGPIVQGSSVNGFRFKTVGRSYEILPRKAKPPTQELGYEPPGSPGSRSPPHWVLHSPFSPLTPGSPLFPDGVINADWISKHQHLVPSVFMSFFSFTNDPARNSLVDNQLKTEINNVKATLYRSEYKTKLVVVLVSDTAIHEAPEMEERLSNIRRATGLDPKTAFFFLPPNASQVEVNAFSEGVLSVLQPGCVEYYRDLTKHARRKKNRGNIPAPTAPPTRGTSQTLAALGWSIRYDFKLGVFSEFRQEMESACRHYTAALEALLGPDGVFETTASWSPRFEEARVLSDMIAMRILRCVLWSNLTSTAVASWVNYRFRLRSMVDGRGKGSSNYGWEAWESRWSRMMATLVRRANLPDFTESKDGEFKIWIGADRSIAIGERIAPFDHLHHPGYWFRKAARHGRQRRRLAQDLPEEDCTPPGQSPASAMASRYGTYDTFLCPEPWQERPNPDRKTYNHAKDIFNALENSASYMRHQPRASDEITLEIARELIKNKQYPQAMKALYHLWTDMRWRQDQWWNLVFEVTRSLRECARQLGDRKVLAVTEFEMYSDVLPAAKNHKYDLMGCDEGASEAADESVIEEEVIELDSSKVTSFVTTSFTFSSNEGAAGEPLKGQLAISSNAQPGSAPVTFEQVAVSLKGSPFGILLRHSHDTPAASDQLMKPTLTEETATDSASPRLTGSAHLELKQGATLIFEFPLIFREAGPISVQSIALTLSTSSTTIRYTSTPEDLASEILWYEDSPKGLQGLATARAEPHNIQIRPRPPKMEIKLLNVDDHFYTDEEVTLNISVLNKEDETTESSLEVRLISESDGMVPYTWSEGAVTEATASQDLAGFNIGTLEPGESKPAAITFTAPSLPTNYVVEAKVLYHFASDPETPISRIIAEDVNVTRAFEANYETQPRVHPDAWPSFFSPNTVVAPSATRADDVEAEEGGQKGIPQRFSLTAQIASFTYEGILISNIELQRGSVSSPAHVAFHPQFTIDGYEEIAPQQQIDKTFLVDVTKDSLEDRRSVEVDCVLAITWKRPSSAKSFTSLLLATAFTVENAPRVLASVSYPSLPPSISGEDGEATGEAGNSAAEASSLPFAQLSFTLENPTNHFLTFELSMEGPQRDEWALSGMKLRNLNLLPLSRETVSYRIVSLEDEVAGAAEGKWLEVRFRVMDVYFRKVLRCVPASNGVRDVEGKAGVLGVWVGGGAAAANGGGGDTKG